MHRGQVFRCENEVVVDLACCTEVIISRSNPPGPFFMSYPLIEGPASGVQSIGESYEPDDQVSARGAPVSR